MAFYNDVPSFQARPNLPEIDMSRCLRTGDFFCPPCQKKFATVGAFREHLSFKHFGEQLGAFVTR